MIRTICIVISIMAYLSSVTPCIGSEHLTGDVQAYVMKKLAGHDIVFMGTTHRQPPILELMVRLAPLIKNAGVTHLALEIASDQQNLLDRFLDTGQGLELIRLHDAIDCPAYRRLLRVLQRLGTLQRPRVIAIDLPETLFSGALSRDEYMAMTLATVLQSQPKAKILAMLGSLHVLRKLPWRDRLAGGHQAIRAYLSQLRPDLNLFSMVHLISGNAQISDFSRRLGPLPGMVALDVDASFIDWRLGITDCLAVRPSQPYELVDGVIVH
jgi:hypothetical protein